MTVNIWMNRKKLLGAKLSLYSSESNSQSDLLSGQWTIIWEKRWFQQSRQRSFLKAPSNRSWTASWITKELRCEKIKFVERLEQTLRLRSDSISTKITRSLMVNFLNLSSELNKQKTHTSQWQMLDESSSLKKSPLKGNFNGMFYGGLKWKLFQSNNR